MSLPCHDCNGVRIFLHEGVADLTDANQDLLEIEMKFPVADFAAVLQLLQRRAVRVESPRQDADHYFNAPDRDFARTDEALRLRRIGAANLVTYKGPKRDALTKTRTEIEVALAEGDKAAEDFARLLLHLGYRPVLVVRKERHVYHVVSQGFPVEICLDVVEDLGAFVELEIMAPASQWEEARGVLLALAAELNLKGSERRSYLELLLEKKNLP